MKYVVYWKWVIKKTKHNEHKMNSLTSPSDKGIIHIKNEMQCESVWKVDTEWPALSPKKAAHPSKIPVVVEKSDMNEGRKDEDRMVMCEKEQKKNERGK